ncbi:hypothetical protein SMACR_04989 [Sordaria macrospora]|uniref:Uncharacterized protein n=1 Tax=Sordaria macrospora TaxID=5147 RepID=A0A8S8ZZI1_SORMA|nr:hypothetical protein SMACR_04989 [Sordaria macrospora]WPJ57470.1 hypothetical protein SMAC4_04989 [Sordaria macrospora]
MDLDGQEQHSSPFIDSLEDDRFDPDSEDDYIATSSICTPFQHLQFHLDMTSPQYLTPSTHHPKRLRVRGLTLPGSTACPSGPHTVAYSPPELDLGPFSVSGISSFNYPATVDTTLLTPISGSESPPLNQMPSPKTEDYTSQSAMSLHAVPTPPHTGRTYYSPYESQDSPSMSGLPSVTEAHQFNQSSAYMASNPHHAISPKPEFPPGPSDPYLGSYSVSTSHGGEVSQHPFPEYPHFPGVEVDPASGYMYRTQQPHPNIHGSPMDHRMAFNGQAPQLTHPNHSQYRPQTTPRIAGFDELRGDPTMFLSQYPSHTPTIAPSKRKRQEKSKTSKPGKASSRTSKESPRPGYTDGSAAYQEGEGNKEELILHDDAPEDDKFLFQLRKEHISEKGKGMWEEMKAKYSERHHGNWEKAALQMKISRAVAKFGVWPEQEIQRLKEAFFQDEEKRYQRLIAHMKEKGGCKIWDWKPQHISAMLIKLGLEDAKIEEKTGTRRRKKLEKRKHTSSALHGGAAYSTPHQNMVPDWSGGSVGLGLHNVFPNNHPQQQTMVNMVSTTRQPSHEQSFYELRSDERFPQLTSEQYYETVEQIFNDPRHVDEDGISSPGFTDVADRDERAANVATSSAHNSRPPTRDELSSYQQASSARMAQQACEQLLQGRQQ